MKPRSSGAFQYSRRLTRLYGQALTGLRVQAPLGARVLSFVCCAPNDGFGPQSGLVQRGVLYAAAWGSENRTTALTGEEMHSPFGGWRHHLPPHFVVGLWVLSHGAMSLQESIERFILSPGWGGKGTRFVREQSDLRIV